MSNHNFSNRKFVERFNTDEACREYLAKVLWNGKPRCPHCGFRKNIYTYTSRPIYKCGNCSSQFRVTTGTIFESTKLPLTKWFDAIRIFTNHKKAMSSHQLSKELGITQKSAWYMETNIRMMLGNKEYKSMLNGIVEVDEVYMVRDKTKKTKQGHGTNKQKVFGMRERNSEHNETGELRITIVDKVNSKTLHPIIIENVELGAWLMSDEWKAYNNLEDLFERGVVNHSKRQYVNGVAHTNSIEGAWSHLRRLISGVYHRPSVKHLQKYLDEFEFRYNHRKKSLELMFKTALKQSNIRAKHSEIKK